MQRQVDGGIVISCDFCGTDWDQQLAMVEGHHGSVICLACLKRALDEAQVDEAVVGVVAGFSCTMCLEDFEARARRWRHPDPPTGPGVNERAVICWADIRQAAQALHKDQDVDFQWDPGRYPAQR